MGVPDRSAAREPEERSEPNFLPGRSTSTVERAATRDSGGTNRSVGYAEYPLHRRAFAIRGKPRSSSQVVPPEQLILWVFDDEASRNALHETVVVSKLALGVRRAPLIWT